MIDPNVCPRTGEVCEWREMLAQDLDWWRDAVTRSESTNKGFYGKAERFMARILPVQRLVFESHVAEAKEAVAHREAALAINCVSEDSCIVQEAMEADATL